MIVLDTSALLAMLLGEPEAERIAKALNTADSVVMSAGTFAEARVVASRRGFGGELDKFLDDIAVIIETLDAADAVEVSKAYEKWGKGFHPARLNLGDCFSYVTAKRLGAPLLFIGNDFGKTDIVSVI